MQSRDRQHGWVGIVLMLVVLLVIAVLGQRMLRAYGFASGAQDDKRSTASPRSAVDSTYAPVDPTSATPMPGNAIDRARGVESTIQQQADDASKRIDAQSR